ncbi:MAG TPA: hypothetical protein VHZ07_25940 [Bryobacteraceae bacterium]|jgi:hypothetical protein|nr:hypothetical protein [Bryobacteraceae bacterium]
MGTLRISLAALLLAGGISAFGQRGGEHGGKAAPPSHAQGGHQSDVGHGYVPPRGPAPHASAPAKGAPAHLQDQPGHPNAPHVHTNGQWVGHESGAKYHLDHPWQHGHFPGAIGASHIYRLAGGSPSRFFLNGFYFSVASPDLAYVNGWLWDSDDLVLYDDPDDPGYYLAYNPRTGVYVHVTFLGS